MKAGKETELYNQSYMDGFDDAQRAHIEPIKPKIKDVKEKSFPKDEDYWTRLEHQYAGMAMQGLCMNEFCECVGADDIATDAMAIAHVLVEKVRYEENPKELEWLKKELEALNIEKTILENKIKLLTEERK